jgi:hypothetical protein
MRFNGDVSLKGLGEPFALLSLLLPGNEVNGFTLPYTSTMMCSLTTDPRSTGHGLKSSKLYTKINLSLYKLTTSGLLES